MTDTMVMTCRCSPRQMWGVRRWAPVLLIGLLLSQGGTGCDRQGSGVRGEDLQFDITGGQMTRVVWCLRRATHDSRKGPWQVGYVVVVIGPGRVIGGQPRTRVVRPDGTELKVDVGIELTAEAKARGRQLWVDAENHVTEIEPHLSVRAVQALADLEGSGHEGVLDQYTELEGLRSFLLGDSDEDLDLQTDAED